MTHVDSAVLNLTEQICHRFQVWTGRTNVWLAFQLTNLSIVVYFIWVTSLYLLSQDLVLRVFVALFCGGVFFVLTRTIFRASIEVAEAEAYRRAAKGLRNPRRIRDAQLRIAFLTLSMLLSYPLWLAYTTLRLRFALLTEALIILTTVVLYVLACDALPPCAGEVREWLRALRSRRTEKVPAIPYGYCRVAWRIPVISRLYFRRRFAYTYREVPTFWRNLMAKSTRTTPPTENVLSMPKRASSTRARRGQSTNPTSGDIALRAYTLYCERGCQDGHAVEDWLQAERELQARARFSAA